MSPKAAMQEYRPPLACTLTISHLTFLSKPLHSLLSSPLPPHPTHLPCCVFVFPSVLSHTLADPCVHTHMDTHYPFLCNWKDALAVCHTTKVDQMAEYPWGSTSPTEWIKEKNLTLSLTTPLCLSFFPSPSPAHARSHSQTQWVRLTVPFLMSHLSPFFCSSPLLQYEWVC